MGCIEQSEYDYISNKIGESNIVWMHCCPEYPAKRSYIPGYPLDRREGVSDHSLDIYHTPEIARDYDQLYLEKHFTALPELDTPDRAHSLTPDEFSEMVRFIKTGNRTEQPMPAWKRRDTEYGYYRPKL
jgi:sialic acid synthase SpsE